MRKPIYLIFAVIFIVSISVFGCADKIAGGTAETDISDGYLAEEVEAVQEDVTDDAAEVENIDEINEIDETDAIDEIEEIAKVAERAEDVEIIWVVEPTLEYGFVYYCTVCEIFGLGHDGDILDTETGLITQDETKMGDGWMRHSYDFEEWLYDEEKDLYGLYTADLTGQYLQLYSPYEFMESFPFRINQLTTFRKINSSMIKESSEWGYMDYDLSDAYIGQEYALAYGVVFVTPFIYDGHENYHNNRDFMASLSLNGKWGIIDKNGIVSAPFIFDDITFIDDSTAFAQYNGKYGIISLEQANAFRKLFSGDVSVWDNLEFDDYDNFIRYLLATLPEAQEYVNMGMAVLITGETSQAGPFPICMDVVLGTSHEEHFVREILYTITPEGGIMKYDPIYGEWDVVFGAAG